MCFHMLTKYSSWGYGSFSEKKSCPADTVLMNIRVIMQVCTIFNTDLGFNSTENGPLKASKLCVTQAATPPSFL